MSPYDPLALCKNNCWAFHPFSFKEWDYALHLIKEFVSSMKKFL